MATFKAPSPPPVDDLDSIYSLLRGSRFDDVFHNEKRAVTLLDSIETGSVDYYSIMKYARHLDDTYDMGVFGKTLVRRCINGFALAHRISWVKPDTPVVGWAKVKWHGQKPVPEDGIYGYQSRNGALVLRGTVENIMDKCHELLGSMPITAYAARSLTNGGLFISFGRCVRCFATNSALLLPGRMRIDPQMEPETYWQLWRPAVRFSRVELGVFNVKTYQMVGNGPGVANLLPQEDQILGVCPNCSTGCMTCSWTWNSTLTAEALNSMRAIGRCPSCASKEISFYRPPRSVQTQRNKVLDQIRRMR